MAQKTVAVTINTGNKDSGVYYAPKAGEPGKDLMHGETHDVDVQFAAGLIHSKRAVLADPDATLDTGPLTTESINGDPSPANADPSVRRKR